MKVTRSKDLRVSLSLYLLLMLREWPPTSMDRVVGHVGGMLKVRFPGAGTGARNRGWDVAFGDRLCSTFPVTVDRSATLDDGAVARVEVRLKRCTVVR